MLNLSADRPLNVLITRPEKKGLSLALHLKSVGIKSQCQPLFDYRAIATSKQTKSALTSCHIAIFVSVAAVDFAHQNFSLPSCNFTYVIAVGLATQKALNEKGINNVITPNDENSEGILALTLLTADITNKEITIVRGTTGRELLLKELTKRHAKVRYLEVYQRQWRKLENAIVKSWQEQQINCIVVTSNELLQRLANIMLFLDSNTTSATNHFWRHQCLWCVASERIALSAKKLNIKNILVSDGASDKAIVKALQQRWNIK